MVNGLRQTWELIGCDLSVGIVILLALKTEEDNENPRSG
jgi:hypothetical protein